MVVDAARRRSPPGRHPSRSGSRRDRRGLAVVTLVVPSESTFEVARSIGPANLRTLDAVHLAAARELGNDLNGIVTYDTRLAAACESLTIEVVAPGLGARWWTQSPVGGNPTESPRVSAPSAPGRIRTYDLVIRSDLLYPLSYGGGHQRNTAKPDGARWAPLDWVTRNLRRSHHGGRSSVGRAPGCGPGGRGFKSPRSPQSSASDEHLPCTGGSIAILMRL